MDEAFGPDDAHAFVDIEGGLFRHAPDRLQGRRGAVVEAVHGLPDVRIFQAAQIDRLGIGADHPRPGEPQHQVGVVDGVADDRSDLVENLRRPGGRNIAPRTHAQDLADIAGGDFLLGHGVARVEAADVADHEMALGLGGGVANQPAIGHRMGHRLFQKHVLARVQRRQGRRGMLVPHGDDADRVDVGIGEQLVVIRIELGDPVFAAELLEPRGRAGAQGGQFERRNRRYGVAVNLAEPSQADHGDSRFLHAGILSSAKILLTSVRAT
jgi:hypothetical protein